MDTEKDETFVKLMHLLHESIFFESKLWPVYGISAGIFPSPTVYGNYKLDSIKINLSFYNSNTGNIRFNIWAKTYIRGYRQYSQLLLILDHTIYKDVYFEAAYPEFYHKMVCHENQHGSVMGMLDIKFEIQ